MDQNQPAGTVTAKTPTAMPGAEIQIEEHQPVPIAGLAELSNKLRHYDRHFDENLLHKAYMFSMQAHDQQKRASGESYFSHPLEVANILADMHLDTASVVTALLHDTVEDTHITLNEIDMLFGTEIAKLVDGVTKLSQLRWQSEEAKQAENFRKLLLAMASDIRVVLVKLVDRLHNMRTLKYIKDPQKRQRIAQETMQIYAPLAERMGIEQVKTELEDLAFSHLHPTVYKSIKKRLNTIFQGAEEQIAAITKELQDLLAKGEVNCAVQGRMKTPYSIWRKMQRKNTTFEQLSDVIAFRLILGTHQECYQALGLIHSTYLMVPGRFKDYISTPKINGYQSLHTTIIGPNNIRIEIQIRTGNMNNEAEWGIAAHWQYKHPSQRQDGKQYAWLRSLLEILEHATDPEEFLEHTKLEMFEDQVFSFTPKGKIIVLPKGATAIDFAYAIHSQVGNHAAGVKINGQTSSLRTVLHNGDQVEIITSSQPTPSMAWERYVITGRARARIRRFLKQQQREHFLSLGKSLIERAIARNLNIAEHDKQKWLAKKHHDDVYVAVGEGSQSISDALKGLPVEHPIPTSAASPPSEIINTTVPHAFIADCLPVVGVAPGMVVRFPNCCHPLPGDAITGIIATGQTVSIHRQECPIIRSIHNSSRILDVRWHDAIPPNMLFIGRLKVGIFNTCGCLAAITAAISQQNVNIYNIRITQRLKEFWEFFIEVEVSDNRQLSMLQATLCATGVVSFLVRA